MDYIDLKGVIYIGKALTGILAALLVVCIVTQAEAASITELEEQISACKVIKETAHQMADCARKLGYADDHIIITTASDRWWEAHKNQLEYENQHNELMANAEPVAPAITWTGPKLTRSKGVNYGPSGKETYYNLNMSGCVNRMRRLGYDATNYPVWTRSDGAKMFGPFIMCAASFSIRPLGTIIESSMGFCIVVDTGSFAYNNPTQIDIATNWR